MSSGSSVFPTGAGSIGTLRSHAPMSDRSATSGFGADVGDTSFGERLAAAEAEVEGALRRNEQREAAEVERSETEPTSAASRETQAEEATERGASADRAARAGDDARAQGDADDRASDEEADDDAAAAEAAAAALAPTVAAPLRALTLEAGAPEVVGGSRIAAALEALVASAQRGTGATAEPVKAPRTPNVDAGAATPAPFSVEGTGEAPVAPPEDASSAVDVVEAATETHAAPQPDSRVDARADQQSVQPTPDEGADFEVHVASETRSNVDAAASNERAARVLEQVRLFVQPGMRRATLELTPANLGRIDVEISVDRGELAAHLRVDAVDTYEALQRHMPELRASLERAGLDVTQLELSFGARGENAPQQRQSGEGRALANARGAARGGESTAAARELALLLRPNTIAVDRVDTLA
jgi:flagellar hook-length control protein FliK